MAASGPTSNHLLQTCLLLLATIVQFWSLVGADCYWHDGSNAGDMQECYSADGADGLCCAPGDICLLNHLCQTIELNDEFEYSLYRGACNMPNWTEAATCPEICVNPEQKDNIRDIQLVQECDETPDWFYCKVGGDEGSNCVETPVFTLSGMAAVSYVPT
ncbi:hypothetical protein diail_11092 [Diaporthe ilicicola]|nr:hypothetical protein diail_11092 [Diaporthe ilicicola]